MAFQRRCLIVNADDFGLGPGINAGIARAASAGTLTSVSLLANGPALAEAAALARSWPHISPGIHLALVGGRPVSPPAAVPSLVDREGRFPAGYRDLVRRLLRGSIDLTDVYREWSAQVRVLREHEVALTHLDSHQHLHVLPSLLPVALAVAREGSIDAVRLPLERWYGYGRGWEGLVLRGAALLARPRLRRAGFWSPDHFVGFTDSGRMTPRTLARHLERLAPGVTELMMHPGVPDPSVHSFFPRAYRWEEELMALTDPTLCRRLSELGIQLVPYCRPVVRSWSSSHRR